MVIISGRKRILPVVAAVVIVIVLIVIIPGRTEILPFIVLGFALSFNILPVYHQLLSLLTSCSNFCHRSFHGSISSPVCHCSLLFFIPFGQLWCWWWSLGLLRNDGSLTEGALLGFYFKYRFMGKRKYIIASLKCYAVTIDKIRTVSYIYIFLLCHQYWFVTVRYNMIVSRLYVFLKLYLYVSMM